ncbi:MAG: hypothetical protein ACQEP1_06655 [Nanobdellota archaeon]
MKENDWKDCILYGSAVNISSDYSKAKSLIETSQGRIDFLGKYPYEKDSINYIFEGYYSSIIELLHALLIGNGYKIRNHLCLGYYLRDVIGDVSLYKDFDDLRYKRNSLVYYGKMMDYAMAKRAVEKSKELITRLREIMN